MAIEFSRTEAQFQEVKKAVVDALRTIFPVEGKQRKMVLKGVSVEDTLDPTDYKGQAAAKSAEQTWGVPVYGHLQLFDENRNIIDENPRVKLFTLPKPTQRHSYIVGGNEYDVQNQLRLRPGVYTIKRQNGELKTQVNLAKGKNFEIHFNENKGLFTIGKVGGGQANIPLYPIIAHLGIQRSEFVKAFGERITASNELHSDVKAVDKMRTALGVKPGKTVSDYFKNTQLDPETTKIALGKSFDRVDGPMLLASAKQLLDVHMGRKDPTDRDSLEFKELHGMDDFIKERLEKNKAMLAGKIKRTIDNQKKTKISQLVSSGAFSDVVEDFFLKDDKASTPEQTNPLEMISGTQSVTFMGAGGIGTTHAIKDEMRQIHPSHFGMIDPVHTPECYDELTQVFTKAGWKFWRDVTEEDLFACLVNEELVFHRAEKLHKSFYEGVLYGGKGGKIDYLVTPNHRMHLRPLDSKENSWRIESAEECHDRPRTFRTTHQPYKGTPDSEYRMVIPEGSSNSAKNFASIKVEDWCEFLGWFLSEGSFVKDRQRACYTVRLHQSEKANPTKCGKIKSLLNKLPWTWCQDNLGKSFAICSRQLFEEVAPQGKQPFRFIPEWVLDAPLAARSAMYAALLLGDGRTFSNRKNSPSYKQEVFCTTSKALAIGFERLAISLGKSVTTKTYQDRREERYLDVFEVRVLQNTNRSLRKFNRRTQKSDYYIEHYRGFVYCATVPGHLLLVKRNGSIPIWLGNSDRIGVNLHLPMGAVKDGKDLKMKVVDKRGVEKILGPTEAKNAHIVFPGQTGSIVKAMYKGEIVEIPKEKGDYFIPNTNSLFSWSTNLIPFLPSAQGNRAMMAAKMMEQSISLKHREAPLVQSLAADGRTMEEHVGEQASIRAEGDGTVKEVADDHIILSTGMGEKKYNLYNNFTLNRKSFMQSHPLVKVGDQVKKGQVIADSNYTRNGVLALGTNLKTAYIPYKGYNFDDGIVISEAAAGKLTSEHIYKKEMALSDNMLLGLSLFRSYYPSVIRATNGAKLDEGGVIKKGSKVEHGDVIIAALQKRAISQDVQIVSKVLSERPKDASIVWTLEDSGTVIDVIRSLKKVTVVIKTEEAAKIGDKLAGRHGNKGVVTKIVPDHEMPHDKAGNPMDILLNPMGVISRINVSQIYESAAAKVAQKEGKPHVVSNFDGDNYHTQVTKLLDKAGVDDKEELIDPLTGKSLGQVHVGNPHILKLFKQSQANYSVRQGGPGNQYDANMQPLKGGGEEGAKSVDVLTMYSLLSHGARENIREMSSVKSTRNDEYWKSFKAGELLPPPEPSFAYSKFMGYLKGAGIDVKKDGSKMMLAPFTDKQVKETSSGAVVKPEFYRAKDMSPIKGGFFDPVKFGGFKGTKWGHLDLVEPVVNPPFESAVKKLTGLGKKYDSFVAGKLFLDDKGVVNSEGRGKTGAAALEEMLKKVDVKGEITSLTEKALKTKGDKLDDINKKLRYLTSLDKLGLRPEEAYIRRTLPVVPPNFRPVYALPDGNVTTSDVNILYQNTGVLNTMMKMPVMDLLAEDDKQNIRKDVHDHAQAVSGLLDMNIKGKEREGFISSIKGGAGGQPKEGFFISKLLSKKQDFVGRGTIIPEPSLSIDEMAMPEPMAWKLFEPFLVREMRNHGLTPLAAMEEIKNKTPLAKRILEIVMEKRHVLLNRAPSLHKYSIMAFRPKITEGKAIKIPPLVNKGFNADYDGDKQRTAVLTFLTDVGISLLDEHLRSSSIGDEGMAARFREIVGIKDKGGDFFLLDLEDFPHTDPLGTKEGEKGRIDFYRVPEGTKVLSYDESTCSIQWKDVFGWSKHYQREVEIVTLRSGRQIVTDDDPRAVYGIPHGEVVPARFTPKEAVEKRVLVPRMQRGDLSLHGKKEVFSYRKNNYRLTHGLGHMIGAMISNGWVETCHSNNTGRIFICCINATLGEHFLKLGKETFGFKGKELRYHWEGPLFGSYGEAKKWGFVHDDAANLFGHLIGYGSKEKHLPPFFLSANREFRCGLFAGLMDHDGSIAVTHSKGKRPGLSSNYQTVSIRLAQEVQWLAKSLGIRSSISTASTPCNGKIWTVSFTNFDMKRWGGEGMLNEKKLAALNDPEATASEDSAAAAKADVVPIPVETAKMLRKNLGAPRNASKEDKTTYTQLHKAAEDGHISRLKAKEILSSFHPSLFEGVPYLEEWGKVVGNTDVTWDPVVSFERTGIFEDGYDLTVPGYETFMNVEGVVLSNTMTVHVPISEEANTEAAKMLPSKNLFKPGTGALMVTPGQESQIGLFYLSKTDAGRAILDKILRGRWKVTNVLDKKGAATLLMQIAKEADPRDFDQIVTALKKEGEKHAYETGFTLGMKDIKVYTKERDKAVEGARQIIQGEDQFAANSQINKGIDSFLEKKFKGKNNPFYDMIDSGARGDPSQLRAIMFSPMFVANHKNSIMKSPISKSYAEGLDVGDYWTSMYGARKGMMDRAVQTSLPGAFSKDVMATTIDTVISALDCGTHDGVVLPIESADVLERYAAGDQGSLKHNTLLDSSLVNSLKQRRVKVVKVRSPLKCRQAKGVCAHCYGLDEHGHMPDVGENVGAKAGQTVSEPLIQIMMNCSAGTILCDDGKVYSFQDLFDDVDCEAEYAEDLETKPMDRAVWVKGERTPCYTIQKHSPHDEMVFVKTKKGHTLLAQANHPVWIIENGDWAEKEVGSLSKGDILPIDLESLKGDEPTPFDPYFIGRYLADGCTRYGNGTKRYEGVPVATIVTGADKDIKERTLQASRGKGVASQTDVQIYDPTFANAFSSIVRGRKAHKKRLMPGFNLWSKADLSRLLAGYIDGDGSVYRSAGTTCVNVYTSSFVLLQQLQIICNKLGVHFSPYVVPRQPLQKSVQFISVLRFTDTSVAEHSVKLGRVAVSLSKKQHILEEQDYVTMVKPLWAWDEVVWDVKTESRKFTCGTVVNHNSFHTGGAAGTGAQAGGFTRISQLLNLPDVLTGAAALAPISGKVAKVVRGIAGGYDVTVGDQQTHIPQGQTPTVAVGQEVKQGDALSTGPIKPQDLTRLKNVEATQDYLTDELQKTYKDQKVGISRKTFETVVRNLTNLTQVKNNPRGSSFLPGDVVPYTEVRAHNENRDGDVPIDEAEGHETTQQYGSIPAGKLLTPKDVQILKAYGITKVKVMRDAIEHQPFVKGMTTLPLLKKDWMAALGYRNLSKVLTEGSAQGWQTDIEGYHPVPAIAHGTTFGKGKEGKY